MKERLKKIWEFLSAVGWALSHGAEAEFENDRRKKTCPNCGYVRQRPTGCGPY